MKSPKFLIIVLLSLLIGYALGNAFPVIENPNLIDKIISVVAPPPSIEGDTTLEVKLIMDNGTPLEKIEVDLGEKAGPPPQGGVAITDENGIAKFSVKPGQYVIYFNSTSFPKNLQTPDIKTIEVSADTQNSVTIILETLPENQP